MSQTLSHVTGAKTPPLLEQTIGQALDAAAMRWGGREALVSVLHNNGEPSVVQRTLIRPPMSRVGPLKTEERQDKIVIGVLVDKELPVYQDEYEKIRERAQEAVGR